MLVEPLAIPDVLLVTPRRFEDPRGWFVETYSQPRYAAAGIRAVFMQDNQSLSRNRGTIRGLHFQRPPVAQAKLVRVLRGRILDVAVDLRRAQPTYGQHVAVELDAATGAQLFVPAGFAHGFCTLEPDTEVTYKVDAPYAPDADAGLFYDDPHLAIAWPVAPAVAHLSDKDRQLPRFTDFASPF